MKKLTNSSSFIVRGMTDVRPEFRFVAAIVLRTSSLTSGMDFFRGLMSGIESMAVKSGLLREK